MKLKFFPLFVLGLLLGAASSVRAGMTVYNPPSNYTGGNFVIYYGLGSPQPGKVAYVYVTEPNGYYHMVGSAENVPDMSQVCYLYASQAGNYRFYYEYSYYSAGVPLTTVYYEDHYIYQRPNSPPSSSLSSSSTNITIGQGITLTSSIYDSDGNLSNQAVDLSTDNSNWTSGWNNWSGQTGWGVSGSSATNYVNYTPPTPGTYYFRSRGQDTSGALSNFVYVTVTVNGQSQPSVNSYDATINQGQSFTPSYNGGAGSGNWQFCISGYTNWNPVPNGPAGTNTPGIGWQTSWTPSSSGSYTFYVAKCGDNTYATSNIAGPYTLTVNPTYALTVNNGSGGGSYAAGQQVSIGANSPPYNQVFSSWSQPSGPGSIADTSQRNTTFTMGAGAATVTANYRTVNFNWGSTPSSAASGVQYNVNVSVDSGGMPYVTLYKNGAYFAGGWFGTQGNTTDTGTQTVRYDANFSDSGNGSSGADTRNVSIYIPYYTLSTSVSPAGAGSVTGAGTYQGGTNVSVTATANAGYAFSSWSGAASGSSNPITVYMDSSKSVTANFVSAIAPSITSQPSNQSVNIGSPASFSVGVSGSTPMSYQWRKNGADIPGATGSSLTFNSAQTSDAGTYSVYVSNAYGSATSNGATLTVTDPNGDTDGDGMPNAWEQAHGLNPNVNDAQLDPDGDGLTNIAEYGLGTDPQVYDAGKSALGGTVPAGWPSAGDTSNPKAVGVTKGEFSVDKNGAATYSIPIWVSPGTAGMEPQLSLNYSSQGGSGIAGFGWSLSGVSQISRGPQTRAVDNNIHGVDFTSADRFYLDGQRLISINGSDGDDGTEYRTEVDSFTKVISHGSNGSGPDWFEAWTKAGLIIEFGHTTDSAFTPSGAGGVLSWSVSKIRDTKGNYMTFTYAEDTSSGTQTLSRIDYTGNPGSGVSPYASVRFTYENRPDWSSGYRVGCLVSNLQRLTTIQAYYGETVARTYTLGYTTRGPSTRSLLTSLTETGKDGTSYPDLTFDYETNSPGWQAQSGGPWVPPTSTVTLQGFNSRPTQYGTGYVDVNGDGRPDFVQYYWDTGSSTATQHAWLNTPSGWVTAEGGGQPDYRPPFPLGYSNNHDTSARFADLDGDGRIDILWHHVTGNNIHESGAYRSTANGWESIPNYAPPFALAYDGDTESRGVYLIDLNGDGRVDLIANDYGNVRLNNGNGWDSASQWSAPCNLARGCAFVDVNGDGLPDIVQRWSGDGTVTEGVYLNNGNGWTALTPGSADYNRYLPPTPLNSHNPDYGWNAPRGTEFTDLNGDGMVDLIARNDGSGNLITPTAYFNTGHGWVLASNYVPDTSGYPGMEMRHDHESRGVAFVDVNGDGLVDMIRAQTGETSVVYYNNGHGWNGGTTGGEAVPASIYTVNWWNQNHSDLVDLNGDGVLDQAGYWNDNGTYQVANQNQSNPRQDRLKSVTNGFGVSAYISYKPLTDSSVYTKGSGATHPDYDIISPMEVVSQVRNDDGVGGTYNIDYTYGQLRTNADRGSQGFGWMKATDARTGLGTTTWFQQAFPYTGMAYLEETTKSDGTVLSMTSTTLATRSLNGGKTQVPYVSEVVAKTYELDGSFITGSDTTTQIDDYANATSVSVGTINNDGSSTGYTKTTTSVFSNDTANWFLGRLLTSSVTSTAPSQSITRTSGYLYDSASGLMTDEVVEPVLDTGVSPNRPNASYTDVTGYDQNTVRTHYEYDSFGNKTAVRVAARGVQFDPNGNATLLNSVEVRSTTTAYDSQGRFRTSLTNAAGHTESYNTFDQVLGVLTQMTGPNGLATSWQYDGFGRKTRETRADTTVTDTRRKWAAVGGAVPSGAKFQIETESTGTVPTLEIYDSFGRVIRTLAINGAGEMTRQDTQYDSMSRAYRKSMPDRYSAAIPLYWTQTTNYDVLGRPLTVQTPDDENGTATTGYTYAGLVITATDAKGRVVETTKNSEGWVAGRIRNKGAGAGATDYTAVTFTYDPLGQVIQTTAAGASTSVNYDVRGHKTQMTDADMGTWKYRYNGFGELVWQKDAKSQIVTMGYDAMGRMVTRVENEGTTSWSYDTATGGTPSGYWKGKIGSISAPGGYTEAYTYDSYGRVSQVSRTIDGLAYNSSQTYDSVGRIEKMIYPTGFQTRNVYNAYGFLKEVRRADSGKNDVYWEADHYSADGRIDGEIFGNGLVNDRVYSEATGRLRSANIDRGIVTSAPYRIQQLTYSYDSVGNVKTRNDGPSSRNESFQYDGLDRLTTYTLSGVASASLTMQYDQKGNITSKSDVGSYTYGVNAGPHAVTGVSGGPAGPLSYGYDANGNMTNRAGRAYTWTSFNQLLHADTADGKYSDFAFGAAHDRVKQTANWGTTIYVGNLFERVTRGSVIENKHYIMAPTGRVAVRTERSDSSVETRFFHSDGLGSITAVTDESGNIVKRFAFDPWGKRLAVDNSTLSTTPATSGNNGGVTRAFTDHEQLDDLGLVHMNGRVYDPSLGRFLSADPNVDDASDAQGFNHYSYLGNNPLGGTDPTGFFSLKDAVKIVAIVVIAYFTAGWAISAFGTTMTGSLATGYTVTAGSTFATLMPAAVGNGIIGGFAAGFASGVAGSLLNGGSLGDAFKAGAVGGIAGAITGGLLGKIGSMDLNAAERGVAHGLVHGAEAQATGGEFRHGFYAGFAVGGTETRIGEWTGDSPARGVTAAAVVGGTASALGGGKFANGAMSGVFSYLFNYESQRPLWGTRKTDEFSVLDMKLTYPAGTDMQGRADDLYASLASFRDFDNPFASVSINGDDASFTSKSLPSYAPVKIDRYPASRSVVGSTQEGHFLLGTRVWQVLKVDGNSITLRTWAIDQPSDPVFRLIDRIAYSQVRALQSKIWESYFTNIYQSEHQKYGAEFGGFAEQRKQIPHGG